MLGVSAREAMMMNNDILQRLEAKVERLEDAVTKNNEHMAVYNELLKIHIKRTDLNEEQIKELNVRAIEIAASVRVLKWLGGLAAATASACATVFELLK